MNSVVLVGRLAQDPELRYIAGTGMPVVTFTLAVGREFTDKNGERGVDFIDIQAWNKQAETVANYLKKGNMVSVNGSIRVENYIDKNGNNRRSFRVNANRVEFLITDRQPNKPQQKPTIEPIFEPSFGEDFEFTAIDDTDLPF